MDQSTDAWPAPAYLPSRELPDPLTYRDGNPVETPADWTRRREELRTLFRRYVYGYAPDVAGVKAVIRDETPALDGTAIHRSVELRVPSLPDAAPSIPISLFLPTDATDVPVVIGLNKHGNHAITDDPSVPITDVATGERGSRADVWEPSYLVDRGYGLCALHGGSIDPDIDDFTDGFHPHVDPAAAGWPTGSEWGTLAAWAWGVQRCVDYCTDADGLDGDRLLVTGHSRRGKASLLAGATDDRIAIVVPHQSGTGGTALSRENGQESIADITSSFPHWFCDLFHGFAGRPDRLPVDQHLLMAMVAPRPLLDTQGERDYWANPGRALDALRTAAPVWELLDATGMVGDGINHGGPIGEDPGDLLHYRHDTEHMLGQPYWETILDFADHHFGVTRTT